MKILNLSCCVVLCLHLLGCDDGFQQIANENANQSLNALRWTSCRGDRACLPSISVEHNSASSNPGVSINWSNMKGECRRFKLSVSGIGSTKNEILSGTGGQIYYNLNTSNYTLSYSLSCDEGSQSCSNCQLTGSYVVIDGKGSSGGYMDCRKIYYPYSLETANSTTMRVVGGPTTGYTPDKTKLIADRYELYSYDRWSHQRKKESEGRLELVNITIPYPFSASPYVTYEVRLYSSACTRPDEHYLFQTFQGSPMSKNMMVRNHNESVDYVVY